MDQKTLDGIKARWEATTKGLWTAERLDRDWHWSGMPRKQLHANREFLTQAHQDVPMLVAEVEQLGFQFDQQRECSTELLAEVERLRAELWIARKGK